jgi:hypothetical protein
MKYVFWILLFPFIGAWVIHFNIIGVLATVGKPPSYYDGAGAAVAWVLFYGTLVILSIVVLWADEKSKKEDK